MTVPPTQSYLPVDQRDPPVTSTELELPQQASQQPPQQQSQQSSQQALLVDLSAQPNEPDEVPQAPQQAPEPAPEPAPQKAPKPVPQQAPEPTPQHAMTPATLQAPEPASQHEPQHEPQQAQRQVPRAPQHTTEQEAFNLIPQQEPQQEQLAQTSAPRDSTQPLPAPVVATYVCELAQCGQTHSVELMISCRMCIKKLCPPTPLATCRTAWSGQYMTWSLPLHMAISHEDRSLLIRMCGANFATSSAKCYVALIECYFESKKAHDPVLLMREFLKILKDEYGANNPGM